MDVVGCLARVKAVMGEDSTRAARGQRPLLIDELVLPVSDIHPDGITKGSGPPPNSYGSPVCARPPPCHDATSPLATTSAVISTHPTAHRP